MNAREAHTAGVPALVALFVADFTREYMTAVARHGYCAVALTGGSAAVHALPALAALPIDWTLTHLFWSDERAVPASDAESNFQLARSRLLSHVAIPAASIHRMPGDAPDLDAAAHAYAGEMARVLGSPFGPFDYALLGVGADGHVASLFPGHAALHERARAVVAVVDSPKPPPRRLTMTMPVLVGARRVTVLAIGAEKKSMMLEALYHPETAALPVAQVLHGTPRPLVLIDNSPPA